MEVICGKGNGKILLLKYILLEMELPSFQRREFFAESIAGGSL